MLVYLRAFVGRVTIHGWMTEMSSQAVTALTVASLLNGFSEVQMGDMNLTKSTQESGPK